jgi:Mat/Ecp fimbriae major subunit
VTASSNQITRRKKGRGAIGPVMALGVAVLAMPANAAETATVSSEAEVITIAALQNTASLDFGMLARTGTGGAAIIDPNTDLRTTIGEVTAVGGGAHRGEFTTSAPVGVVMVMSGDPNVVLTRLSGSETMNASLIYRPGSGLLSVSIFGLPIGLLATQPTQTINVGGTLIVAGNQVPGDYEGTFELTVSYL